MTDPKTPALPEPVAYRYREHNWPEGAWDILAKDMHGTSYVYDVKEPMYSATQLQEALDRATTAEAALEAERDAAHNEALEKAALVADEAAQAISNISSRDVDVMMQHAAMSEIADEIAFSIRCLVKETPNADK